MKMKYEQPRIDLIKIKVEKGFALSLHESGVNLQRFYYDSSLGEEEEDTFFN